MTADQHIESHFEASEVVRDVVIGVSDGLTVPFALAAGLAGAVQSSQIILLAGVSEIVAGAIAMGLGGFLAAKGEYDHYHSELRREHREIKEIPEEEKREVLEILMKYGLSEEACQPVIDSLVQRPKQWVEFMMRFELGLEKPQRGRAFRSALTIALAYVLGGLIPLAPYGYFSKIDEALWGSAGVTLLALFIFGFLKGRFLGLSALKSAVQTTFIGALAAGAAYFISIWIAAPHV